jgi:hypothetical protein
MKSYGLDIIKYTLYSKYDLDLRGRDTGVTYDTSAYHCDYCAKYFQKPLIYEEIMEGTQNITYNRLC